MTREEMRDALHSIEFRTKVGVAQDVARFGRASRAFEGIADKAGVARSAGNLGLAAMERGDTPTAERHLSRSHALHHELGDELSAAGVAYSLGVIAWECGDIAEARARFRETLTVFEKSGLTDHRILSLIRKALAQIDGK
jgi:hypothetical protein